MTSLGFVGSPSSAATFASERCFRHIEIELISFKEDKEVGRQAIDSKGLLDRISDKEFRNMKL